VIFDFFADFGARSLTFGAQQITSGQVNVAKVLNDLGALGSLAGAGTA
jgi:hypothetical protein